MNLVFMSNDLCYFIEIVLKMKVNMFKIRKPMNGVDSHIK